MAGGERPGQRPDASAATVAAFPPASEVAAQVRKLAKGFDTNVDYLRGQTGFDQRKLPFAVRLKDMTQAHLDAIALMFGTTCDQTPMMGRSHQTIAIPGTENKMIFSSNPKRGTDDSPLNTRVIGIFTPSADKDFHQVRASDQYGERDIVVVLGPDSVSFVQNPKPLADAPKNHITATINRRGYNQTIEYDYKVLEDPIHALNLAKAITVFNPEVLEEPVA